jgi:hypothetical protein
MSSTKKALRLASLTAVVAAGFAAMGFASASQSINLTAEVPLLCQVSFDAASGSFDTAGVAELGATREFCNAGSGYRVLARVDGADEGTSLIVNGARYDVSNGREFVMVDVNSPARVSRSVSLDAGDGEGGGRLSLRIEAK